MIEQFSKITDVPKGELLYTAGRDAKTSSTLDISLDVSQKLGIDIPSDPPPPLPGTHPKALRRITDILTTMFISSLLTSVKKLNESR